MSQGVCPSLVRLVKKELHFVLHDGKNSLNYYILIIYFVCMSLCVCGGVHQYHSVGAEVRRQLREWVLSTMCALGVNSGCQAWWHYLLSHFAGSMSVL